MPLQHTPGSQSVECFRSSRFNNLAIGGFVLGTIGLFAENTPVSEIGAFLFLTGVAVSVIQENRLNS